VSNGVPGDDALIVPHIPHITPTQGAAIRELILSASLLIILRFRVTGLLPEAHDHLMLKSAPDIRSAANV
jgi:hypothetical protein